MTPGSLPPSARRQVTLAIGAWLLLAVVVFSVRFDWQTRVAGYAFVRSQYARQAQGLPLLTINDGFRPMVRDAAREAAVWLVLIAAAGSAATATAASRERRG
jgi:hypothetical protein